MRSNREETKVCQTDAARDLILGPQYMAFQA